MATTPVLPAHVAVAHHLIGMCHHGLPADQHERAVHRARRLADTLDRGAWLLLTTWADNGWATLRTPLHDLIPRVHDCLAGIANDHDFHPDPFDGAGGHDAHKSHSVESHDELG